MLQWIVEGDGLIVVCSTLRDTSRQQRGIAHDAMPNHNWDCRPLLLRERQELRREITTDIAVEGRKIRYPEGVENLEQQQRVFGRLSQRFSLLDQQTRLLRNRPG